jgi:secreted Zn-dependent insulinase-like peptidase
MRAIDLLEVSVSLTDLGERNYTQVLKAIYSYINKIKSEGIKEYIFREKQTKAQIDFDYKTKSNALSYANVLGKRALRLKEDEIEDILWVPHSYEIYNP